MTAEGKEKKKKERGLVWESEGLEEEAPFSTLAPIDHNAFTC